MRSDTKEALIVIAVGTVGIVSMFCFALWLKQVKCLDTAKAMNVPAYYTFTTGCMIEPTPGKYIPLSNYRIL